MWRIKMKTIVVESSELRVNCWAWYRFVGTCGICPRYNRCTYPERNDKEEEALEILGRKK